MTGQARRRGGGPLSSGILPIESINKSSLDARVAERGFFMPLTKTLDTQLHYLSPSKLFLGTGANLRTYIQNSP